MPAKEKQVEFKKLIDFETRKSLHVSITSEAFKALKIACYNNNLSLQEMMNYFCTMILNEDPTVLEMISQFAYDKRSKKLKNLSKHDEESIYNVLKEINPLSNQHDK